LTWNITTSPHLNKKSVHLLIDEDESNRVVERRKEALLALSIQQLSDDSKLSHALRFEVLEHLCPPELVSELLSRCHAWGERERSLNQPLVVYYVIALSLFRRLAPFGGPGAPGAWAALAVVEPVCAPTNGSRVGLSPPSIEDARHAPSVPARLPPNGNGADQRGHTTRPAADGHRWHAR